MRQTSDLTETEILEFRGDLSSYVIPILFADDRDSTVGSSIPLKIGSHLYLASAEHVFKKNDGSARYPILIPSADKWVVGNITEHNPRMTAENLDVTFFQLPISVSYKFPSAFKLVPPEMVKLDFTNLDQVEGWYAIVGFPSKRNESKPVDGKWEINYSPSVLFCPSATEEELKAAEANGYDRAKHLVCFYDRNSKYLIRTDGKMGGFRPNGMSGGAMWHLRKVANGTIEAKLAGVFTTYIERSNILIGTKIQMVTEAIRRNIPEAAQILTPLLRIDSVQVR